MPRPPHKIVTGLDFQAVENQITALQLVVAEIDVDPSLPRDEGSVAFLEGAIAALTWVTGAATGSEFYSAQLHGEELIRKANQAVSDGC